MSMQHLIMGQAGGGESNYVSRARIGQEMLI